ncbi:hypothetical protein L6452_26229 [Arctium lappa]|uniref:Uncharacterized protein n=1 Tax=Arctium lappa TaxID=4217 RepID=A0ACB9AD19_ARCLA|nr:hypothetical protein L6452_26229 [Arctium lappa]
MVIMCNYFHVIVLKNMIMSSIVNVIHECKLNQVQSVGNIVEDWKFSSIPHSSGPSTSESVASNVLALSESYVLIIFPFQLLM